jgi:hypothetical protein
VRLAIAWSSTARIAQGLFGSWQQQVGRSRRSIQDPFKLDGSLAASVSLLSLIEETETCTDKLFMKLKFTISVMIRQNREKKFLFLTHIYEIIK